MNINLKSYIKTLFAVKSVQVTFQGLLSICILLSLLACQHQEEKEADVHTEKEATSTSQLKALAEMKYISHTSMDLAVDINFQGGGPAYLSVYSKYVRENNDHWKINYDSRLLASYMINSQIRQEIAIPQHLTRLLVQVWFYDDRAPVSKEILIDKRLSIQL